ncbi:hypothetical protein [Pedobacter nototheniae]|uniref:hypothetical protein n=1 Tax=Pedobacter nototheniae TaxID=2488994 RepID=UPI00292D50BA|nr:hypothetical protein [Pedobacter nototheniae]
MKKLFSVLALFIPFIINAQTIKTDVLVLGNGDAAYSAGLQASRSGAKTIILTQKEPFDLKKIGEGKPAVVKKMYLIIQIKNIASMSLPDEEQKPSKKKKGEKETIDSARLFKIINNIAFQEIKRSGNGWDVKLTKDKNIKAKVLILADDAEKTISALKIQALKPAESSALNYNQDLYRTTIAGINNSGQFLSLYNLIPEDQGNLIFIPAGNLEIGQAAGATAAAFYTKKTSESALKTIQGKLLSYKLPLLPFEDVETTDSNWLAIQKIGVTGIIKAELKNGSTYFNPSQHVKYDEIKQPLKDYYYKAQIWFDDHQNVPIDLENVISMVCYVGNKSVGATKNELEKKWNKTYKFNSKYDLKSVLTRREFSVVINDYLKPFDVINVDKTGRIIR